MKVGYFRHQLDQSQLPKSCATLSKRSPLQDARAKAQKMFRTLPISSLRSASTAVAVGTCGLLGFASATGGGGALVQEV